MASVDTQTHTDDIHIVDELIQDRAPKLIHTPFWPAIKLIGYPLLGYRRAVSMADTIASMTGTECLDWTADFLDLNVDEHGLDNVPAEGACVIVANHPHGLVDGMVLAELVGRVRTDYKILTRAILTGADEVDPFVIPVPFPHEADARERNLEMRKRAMSHLKGGGVVVIFPSGAVANSETFFGPAEEAEWNPFTAKMIQRSGAVVVPVRFPGQNSRAYLIASKLSATLRQGLLIHEVVHARHKPQAPIVGPVIGRDEIESWSTNSRGFMAWLREKTLSL